MVAWIIMMILCIYIGTLWDDSIKRQKQIDYYKKRNAEEEAKKNQYIRASEATREAYVIKHTDDLMIQCFNELGLESYIELYKKAKVGKVK